MDEEHSLSDAHIEKYMTEFELSKEQIIQLHEDFFGIQRKEMKCCLGSSTLRIGIVNNAFVAIAENGASENKMIENGCIGPRGGKVCFGKKQFLFNPKNPKKSFDVYIDKNPKDTIPIKYKTTEKQTMEKSPRHSGAVLILQCASKSVS
mgnify:CR=1 FL=1